VIQTMIGSPCGREEMAIHGQKFSGLSGDPDYRGFFSAFPEDPLNDKAVYIDAMKVYRRNGGTASLILSLRTRRR